MSTPNSRFILANFIGLIVSYDHEAELARIRLAEEENLDLFHYYRKIDRSKNGFINKADFAMFLNSYGVFLPGEAMEKFFRRSRDNKLKLTYNDFINQLLPVSAPDLKRQCLAQSGDAQTEYSQSVEKSMEAKIANIYSKEAELTLQFQEALNACPKDLDVDEFVFTLCDHLTGYLDYAKIEEFMNENGFEFDPQRYEYLVKRLCTNQVNRISPTDLLKYLFPHKFVKPKEPAPQEDIHRFKFATKPFTITQRPASASKYNLEPSPLKSGGPSLYHTQPRASTPYDEPESRSSPVKPIEFPDLNNMPAVDNVPRDNPKANSQRNSAVKTRTTAAQEIFSLNDRESFGSPNAQRLSAKKNLSVNTGTLRESPTTGKFPNNAEDTIQRLADRNRNRNSIPAQPQIPSNQASNQKYGYLQANRVESFGMTNNTDLVSRLNVNTQQQSRPGQQALTSNIQNKYSTLAAPPLQEEPMEDYDYRQGFYTNKGNGNMESTKNVFTPLFPIPLKYSLPLRETTQKTNLEYAPSNLNPIPSQQHSQELSQRSSESRASTYNAPVRFYSPKYTRVDNIQPTQNENVSKYTTNIEYKYTQPVSYQTQTNPIRASAIQYQTPIGKTSYGQSHSVYNPTYSIDRTALDSSKQSWKEKIEMSRKMKGDTSYKFGNNAYGKMWNPEGEQ